MNNRNRSVSAVTESLIEITVLATLIYRFVLILNNLIVLKNVTVLLVQWIIVLYSERKS